MAKTKKGSKTKAAAPEVDETEDDELEELDEDEAEETAPSKKADEVTFGASDLAKYLSKKSGKNVTPRELRTLIRKMARDGSGRVTREIVQGNRSRYNWSGPDDPEVKAIIKAFNSGELEADKQEKLAALKERKAAQKAEAEKAGTKSNKKGKKAAAPVVEEDDEDLDLEDDDDE
jgi:hypothetical protein